MPWFKFQHVTEKTVFITNNSPLPSKEGMYWYLYDLLNVNFLSSVITFENFGEILNIGGGSEAEEEQHVWT